MKAPIVNVIQTLAPLLEQYVPNADDYRFRLSNGKYHAEVLIQEAWELVLTVSIDDLHLLDKADMLNIKLKVEAYLQNRKDAQHRVRIYV